MKRWFSTLGVFLMVLSFGITAFAADATVISPIKIQRNKTADQGNVDSFAIWDTSVGVSAFRVTENGDMYGLDTAGNTDFYRPRDRVVRLFKASQFTSWEKQAATAGMSIYQLALGKIYEVDLQAIYLSGVTDGHGVSAFATAAWSGVTLLLPDATNSCGPAFDLTVTVVSGTSVYAGNSIYTAGISGNTVVQVWAYPGMAGLTAYHLPAVSYDTAYRSGCTPQTLLTEYTTNGSTGTYGVGTGVSYWELNKVGESTTFSFRNQSGVSAFVRAKKVAN